MRATVALCLFACMLSLSGLSGCSLTKKSKPGSSGGQPFLGTPSDSSSQPDSNTDNTFVSKQESKPGRGLLAGEVKDVHGRGVADVTIKVVEEPNKDGAAPLTVTTERGGYFYLTGLDVGRSYRLTAKKRDGNRNLVGSVRVRTNDPRVLIPLTGDEPAGASEKADEKTGGDKTGSPASLLAPHVGGGGAPLSPDEIEPAPPAPPNPEDVRQEKEEAREPAQKPEVLPVPLTPPQSPPPPVPQLEAGPNLELFAKDKKNGFEQGPPAVSIPGREKKNKPMAPDALPSPPMSDGGLKQSSAPSAAPDADERPEPREEQAPLTKVVVPSCVRDGNRVVNFTLYDYDGNVWELKKKRRGKLVLLVFWYSKCVPCKHAIPYLNRLNSYYRDYGLDVVSIAHESGTPVEKQDAVRPVRSKITYPILFTGGGNRTDCPVLRQFEVQGYPGIYLLDDSGRIVWRGNGLTPRTEYDLEMFIRKQFKVR